MTESLSTVVGGGGARETRVERKEAAHSVRGDSSDGMGGKWSNE